MQIPTIFPHLFSPFSVKWTYNTKVVPKLVLILSRQTRNAIYCNSNKAHILCSTLLFQQAFMMSVCQIDLELQLVLWKQLHVPLQKKKRQKWTKTHIYSLTPSSIAGTIHLTFSFSKYHLFAVKYISILSTHFFMVVSNSSFRMCPKIIWISWITWAPASNFWPHSSHFNVGNTRNHMVWGPSCMADASSFQCCGTQATLAQQQTYLKSNFCIH